MAYSLQLNFGEMNLISPKMQHLRFQSVYNFFLQRTKSTKLVDEIEVTGLVGFATWAYFVNPRFEPGGTVAIRVVDKNNPDLLGSVTFKLGSVR